MAKRSPVAEQRPKMLARYTQALLVSKGRQLVTQYCVETLKQGVKPRVPQLRPRWWSKWCR
eukprot:1625979-Pyramimonas_sp.AAC.1